MYYEPNGTVIISIDGGSRRCILDRGELLYHLIIVVSLMVYLMQVMFVVYLFKTHI
jgi:hypothetical protein